MANPSKPDLTPLWQRYLQQGDMAAREQLIQHYLYLVKYAVGRMLVNLPAHLDADDLISYGLIGLLQSMEKYDLARQVKFETFAMTRIRGAIIDELRSQDWVPRSLRRKAREVEQAIQRLEALHGRAVSDQEIAAELGITLEELQQILSETSLLVVSLDYLLTQDSYVTLEETIPDERTPQPQERALAADLQERLQQAIQSLPEREKLLVSLYYYEGLTMKEIGRVLSVTEARVCQLHSQAVHRLRARVN